MERKPKADAPSKPTDRAGVVREQQELDRAIAAELRKIQVTLPLPPGPDELERRARVIDRVLQIRQEIGPLDLALDTLLARIEEAND